MRGAVGCLRQLLGGLIRLAGLGALLFGLLVMLGANVTLGAVLFVAGCLVFWLGWVVGDEDRVAAEERARDAERRYKREELRQRKRAQEIADGIEEYFRRNR